MNIAIYPIFAWPMLAIEAMRSKSRDRVYHIPTLFGVVIEWKVSDK